MVLRKTENEGKWFFWLWVGVMPVFQIGHLGGKFWRQKSNNALHRITFLFLKNAIELL